MSLLKKLRDVWANRDRVSEDDARPPSRDPHEINIDNAGPAGSMYPGPGGGGRAMAPPSWVRDDEDR